MSEVQRLLIEEDGEIYEIYVEAKTNPELPDVSSRKRPGGMGAADRIITHSVIRNS